MWRIVGRYGSGPGWILGLFVTVVDGSVEIQWFERAAAAGFGKEVLTETAFCRGTECWMRATVAFILVDFFTADEGDGRWWR